MADTEQQLAVLSSPRSSHVRHRSTASRDLEEAPLLLSLSPLSPHQRAPATSASPPLTPRSARPLRALAPAGAQSPLAEHKTSLCTPSRRRIVFALALVVFLTLLFTWGVANPADLACRPPPLIGANPFLAVSQCDGSTPRFATPVLRLNDVQVLGTHNSYHVAPRPALSSAWRYTHESLTQQLDLGARAVELDVHHDPILRTWQVYHEPWVDPHSTCKCLMTCLRELARWSERNPGHSLLHIVVEPKYNIDAVNPFRNGATAALRSLQDVFTAALPPGSLLTPAAVQGNATSMRAAISGASGSMCGWPSARETRGGMMLILDVWDENKDAGSALRNLPLAERLFFLRSTEGDPDAVPDDSALVEPEECGCTYGFDKRRCSAIYSALVRAGYLVRASVGTAACAPYDTQLRSAAAAAAGVQLITTDYLRATSLPCGDDAVTCCVPGRSSAAPCDADAPQ